MAELDHLRSLGSWVEWPPAPDVAARLELGPRPARRRGRLVVAVAVAVAGLAIAAAMAVPQARSSILRFFHIGGVTIERVSTVPRAEERSLAADLGNQVTAAQAQRTLGTPVALPNGTPAPTLYESSGVVSALLATPEPVLLSEMRATYLMKKVAGTSTGVESLQIEPGLAGLWITGARHVYIGPAAPPRLAGNVLLWERGGVTFRLEGRELTKKRALELARQIAG